jgi:hypothetical protein
MIRSFMVLPLRSLALMVAGRPLSGAARRIAARHEGGRRAGIECDARSDEQDGEDHGMEE